MDQTPQELDQLVRKYIYDIAMQRGSLPSLSETSTGFDIPLADVQAAFQRLAEGHNLVLQPENGEILMANPFSAVPTPFLVKLGAFNCFGNCIWDALGIAAMMKQDALIKTACGDCGIAMELSIEGGQVRGDAGIIHFALPARRWWEDIVFN
jgi:hypothetical protein